MTREIPLTQGQVAIVNDDDYAELSKYKWYAHKASGVKGTSRTFYAQRNIRRADGTRTTLQMHQQIMGPPPPGMEIDHINHPGTDNRRSNLRFATRFENAKNSCKRKDNTSGHKGVTWDRKSNKWRVIIMCNKKCIRIGRFANKEVAIAASVAAISKYHGIYGKVE